MKTVSKTRRMTKTTMSDAECTDRLLRRINEALLGKNASDPKDLGDAFLQVFPDGADGRTAEEIGQELLDLQAVLFEEDDGD